MDNFIIEPAQAEDHLVLTKITMLSKNHWDYGAEQIEAWKEDLTISPSFFSENKVYKLIIENEIVAYYAYHWKDKETIYLENLFIHPDYIGKGLGKLLMEDFYQKLQEEKESASIKKITLKSDPHAEPFYLKLGFVTVGQSPSSIPGRFLPLMEKNF